MPIEVTVICAKTPVGGDRYLTVELKTSFDDPMRLSSLSNTIRAMVRSSVEGMELPAVEEEYVPEKDVDYQALDWIEEPSYPTNVTADSSATPVAEVKDAPDLKIYDEDGWAEEREKIDKMIEQFNIDPDMFASHLTIQMYKPVKSLDDLSYEDLLQVSAYLIAWAEEKGKLPA